MRSANAPEVRPTPVLIRRPPADVWDFVSDLERTPRWRTTVTSIEPPTELKVGERFSGTTRLIGRTWKWVLELTEVDPPSTLGYVVVDGVAELFVTYRVDEHPMGSRFSLTGGVEKAGFVGRMVAPFAARALERETPAHLENLKRILESDEA